MLSIISRAQLIEATELTLERVAERIEIPGGLAEQVREVAQTVARITTGWWDTEHQCGCLIGTLLGPDVCDILNQIEAEQLYTTPESEIAYAFPSSLYRMGINYEDAYEVID